LRPSSRFTNSARLIVEGDGIVVTNAAGLSWLSYDTLVATRPDLIHLQVLGRHDGWKDSDKVDVTLGTIADAVNDLRKFRTSVPRSRF
jgi:hypothetical protein